MRRCTLCRSANSTNRKLSTRRSLRICSNSSTRDLATFDLHVDAIGREDRNLGGANIRETTRRPTREHDHHPGGPKFVTTTDQTGVQLGDHTPDARYGNL